MSSDYASEVRATLTEAMARRRLRESASRYNTVRTGPGWSKANDNAELAGHVRASDVGGSDRESSPPFTGRVEPRIEAPGAAKDPGAQSRRLREAAFLYPNVGVAVRIPTNAGTHPRPRTNTPARPHPILRQGPAGARQSHHRLCRGHAYGSRPPARRRTRACQAIRRTSLR